MSIVNGIVIYPIDLPEVAQILGEPEDTGSVCCSQRVNMFALYKPQLFFQEFPITFQQRVADDFGITPKDVRTLAELANFTQGNRNGWEYRQPIASMGDSFAFRLNDFVSEDGTEGYYHNAPNPIYNVQLIGNNFPNNLSGSMLNVLVQYELSTQSSGRLAVTLDRFQFLKNYYIGIYCRSSAGHEKVVTSPTRIIDGNGGIGIDVKTYGMAVGSWVAYPFIAETPYNSDEEEEHDNVYYTVPFASPMAFTIYNAASGIAITLTILSQNALTFSIRMDVKNNTSSSVTLRNGMWVCSRAGGREDEEEGTTEGTISNITLASGGSTSVTINGNIEPIPGAKHTFRIQMSDTLNQIYSSSVDLDY